MHQNLRVQIIWLHIAAGHVGREAEHFGGGVGIQKAGGHAKLRGYGKIGLKGS